MATQRMRVAQDLLEVFGPSIRGMSRPTFLQRLRWSLALRCPNCGARGLFHRWFKMTKTCPSCGLVYERMPGYWLGSMILNFAVTAASFLAVFVVIVATTWPDPPWTTIWVVSMLIAGITPFLAFPWTRTVFSAIDLALRPPDTNP